MNVVPPRRQTMVRKPHGGRRVGQSVVELAIIIPFLVILLLGGFNTTMLVSDKLMAGYTVRQGARLAAELGGQRTNPGVTQSQIDQRIVRNVLAVASGMRYVGLTEIDIYQANGVNGVSGGQSGRPVRC